MRYSRGYRPSLFPFYFSSSLYSLLELTNTIIRNASVLQIHKLAVHPPTPKYTPKNISLPRPNPIQSKYIPHPQAYSVKIFSDVYLGSNLFLFQIYSFNDLRKHRIPVHSALASKLQQSINVCHLCQLLVTLQHQE